MASGDELQLSFRVAAPPSAVYAAWLDPELVTEITGSEATADGAAFSAWDGYITGVTQAAEPGHRVVQAWRTSEFPEDAPDSVLVVEFTAVEGGTEVSILHSELPKGDGPRYRDGWEAYYAEPFQTHFGRLEEDDPKPRKKR